MDSPGPLGEGGPGTSVSSRSPAGGGASKCDDGHGQRYDGEGQNLKCSYVSFSSFKGPGGPSTGMERGMSV